MANLLQNAAFGAAPGPPTLLIGLYHAGKSAAPHWSTWNNYAPAGACAYTSTAVLKLKDVDRLVPSPHDPDPPKNEPDCFGAHDFLKHAPHKAKQVLEVSTNGKDNGIFQVFGGSPPPQHTMSTVWVFVLRGRVGMGTGNGGLTGINVQSTKMYEWELLQAPNVQSPSTEFIVYSTSEDGAWYFVANASVVVARKKEKG